jgi:hypothetical protein
MKLLPPPGPDRTRQLTALAVLAAVGGLAWYLFGGGSQTAPPATASNSPTTATAAGKAAGPVGLPEPLKLAALGASGDPEGEAQRNPFRFGQPPPPPAPKYVPPPAAIGPPPLPPGPPPAPDIPLQLVLLETLPGNVRTAMVRDTASSALFSGQEGQVLDGRYRLVKIGLESVVVSYLDGSGQKTLPLAR